MHNFRLWFYLVLGLAWASVASAQSVTINGVPIEAIGAGRAYIQPNGTVTQGIGFKATPPNATQPSYYQRAVNFSKGTTGKNIKQFAKNNAYQLTMAAAIIGVGYFLDYATGDIYPSQEQAGTPALTCNPSYTVYHIATPAQGCSVSGAIQKAFEACNAHYKSNFGPTSYCIAPTSSGVGTLGPVLWYCGQYGPTNWAGCGTAGQREAGTNWSVAQTGTYNQPAIAGTPVTDDAAADVAPQLDPDTLDKLATHPDTGAVKQTQEVLDKMTELANELAKLADPNAPTVTAPTATNTAQTTDTPQPAAQALPPACIWFKAACDFFDWVKTPATPDPSDNTDFTVAGMIQENEIEVQNYSSGLGSGSCPAPDTVSVMGASLEFSYQPLCDLAGVARLFVLLFAYISSVYILLGMKRS